MVEEIDTEPRYAGFYTRLYATLIDITLSTMLVFPFIPKTLKQGEVPPELQRAIIDLQSGLITPQFFLIEVEDYMLYGGGISAMFANSFIDMAIMGIAVILFWIYRSATPGKMIFSLKIVDVVSNEKPSNLQVIVRYFAYIISGVPLFLGFVWVAFDKKKQGWHDKIAGTAVISTKQLDPDWKKKRFKRQTIMIIIFVIIFLLFYFNNA